MSAPNHESPVDRAIREAAERGEFDHLESAGKPLTSSDAGEDWWLKQYAEREGVLGQEFLPESLRIRKEVETLVSRHVELRSEAVVREAKLREEVESLNSRIRNEIRTPTSPVPLYLALLDADAIVEQWQNERAARQPPPAPPTPAPVESRRWWQRRRDSRKSSE